MCNHVVAWKFWYNPVGSLKFVNNLVVDLKNREIWGQSWCNPLLTGKSPKKFLQPCTWWKWDKNLCTTLYYTGFCIILLFWPICAIFSHLRHLCLASVPSVLSVPICACLCHLGQPSCPCCSQKICCPSQILSNEFRLFGFFWMLNVRFRPKLENPVSVNHYTTCYLSHSTFNRAISPSWHYTLETVYSCHFYVPFMWHFTTIQY